MPIGNSWAGGWLIDGRHLIKRKEYLKVDVNKFLVAFLVERTYKVLTEGVLVIHVLRDFVASLVSDFPHQKHL